MGPTSNDKQAPLQEGGPVISDRQKQRRQWDHTDKNGATSQAMPTATKSQKRQRTDFPLEPPERSCHAWIPKL